MRSHLREKIDRRSSSYIAWEVYQEAGRARIGVFSSLASSTGAADVPKKFLKKDMMKYGEMSSLELLITIIQAEEVCFLFIYYHEPGQDGS